MCFAPQRRALFRHLNFQKWYECGVFLPFLFTNVLRAQRHTLFRHLNFQKWSEREVFLAFLITNVLRATTACTFSTAQLPKVVRCCCALYILTWKRASRHNGVQFFISHLASWLRTRRFSEVTFRPSRATNHWKHTVHVTFLPFRAPASSCFPLFLLLTSWLLLPDSSHLCFSISAYCRKSDF